MNRIDISNKNITYYDIDIVRIEEIFEKHKVDVILHCATNYGRKENDNLTTVEANLLLPLKLLELGRRYNTKIFINTDTILDKGVNTYSLSKNQFKEWLKEYSNDLICCNIALEHFYGPNDNTTKFVSYVIDTFVNEKDELPLTLGFQKRDFIYIDDVVDAMIIILKACSNKKNGFYHYEIGTGDALSIRHFVELIKELTNNSKTIIQYGAIPYRDNEIMSCSSDIEAISKLGWSCKYSLVQGLKETIKIEKETKL